MKKLVDIAYEKIFLTRKTEDEFIENVHKLFEKNKKNVEIYKDKIEGRSFVIDAYILENDGEKYIFPIENDFEINLSRSIFYKAAQKGKFFPRGMPRFLLYEMYSFIQNDDEIGYMEILKKVYSKDVILSIFIDSMCYTKNFKNYLELIESSIKNFILGDYLSAISLLLPCIEGINRKNLSLDKNEYYRDNKFREKAIDESIRKWIDLIYSKEERNYPSKLLKKNMIYYYLDEVVIMIDSYYKYLDKFLYMKSSEFKKRYPNETLNRHEILHGYSTNYGTEENWYKLFSILDFLLLVDEEYNLERPQRSIKSLKKFYQLDLLLEQTKKIKNIDMIYSECYEIMLLSMLKKSVENTFEEIFNTEKKSLYERGIEFKYLLADNLKLPLGEDLDYYIDKYSKKNIVEVKFGNPNIFSKKTSKDLLIISIDDEKITDEELLNVHFIIKISTKEKKIEGEIINMI